MRGGQGHGSGAQPPPQNGARDGFVQEVDQALSKSLMVEFLRLKVITRDNLSATL